MAYAEKTEVALEKSIAELIGMLRRRSAGRIGQVEDKDEFAVQFFLNDRMLRFRVKFPSIDDMPKRNGNNVVLTNQQRWDRREQWVRQRGRALMLVIKAKLESVDSQVETFEEAFLSNIVMADGLTVYERTQEHIAVEYQTGKIQEGPLLLGGPR